MLSESLELLILLALLALLSIAALLYEYKDSIKYHLPDWLSEELIQMGILSYGEESEKGKAP